MYLLPQPQNIVTHEGYFLLTIDCRIDIVPSCPAETFTYARKLQQELAELTGYPLCITRSCETGRGITLCLDPSCDRKEAYQLSISQDGIRLTGGSLSGLFYGMQTLIQIVQQSGPCVPCMEISDSPALPVRGFYHDVTRGRIPTLAQLKKLADKMARYKMNQLHLYIEHSFLFRDFSEVWRDDTPLTAQDILELDAYCRERFIDLVPSIASFGHLYKVLRTHSYRHLCELSDTAEEPFGFVDRMRHHTLDVSNPDSLALVKKMIDEYLPLFSSDYFNIGADETFDLGKGRSKNLADTCGTSRLYIDFVRELCEHVVSYGKIPMFWGDIICNSPELIHELPKQTICLNWGYEADVDETSTRKLSEAGATIYNCPGVSGWDQLVNQIGVSYENIRRMASYGYKYHAAGLLTTDWGDCGHINHPDFSVTGMIYGAAFSWNSSPLSMEDLNKRISVLEFTDASEKLLSLLAAISGEQLFTWRDLVDFMEGKSAAQPTDENILPLKKNSDLADTPQILAKLDHLAEDLYRILPSLEIRIRPSIKPYLTAIKGLQLIHRTGILLSAYEYRTGPVLHVDPLDLAVEWEYWLMDYKEDWRKVSRESELYRIQNVIFYYADYLRNILA